MSFALGEIEFGRMMRDLLTERLEKLGVKMTLVDKDLGYELRCADPIPFDAEYTRDLGYGAVKFLLSPEVPLWRDCKFRGWQDGAVAIRENARSGDQTHAGAARQRGWESYECARIT